VSTITIGPIARNQPGLEAGVGEWVNWYWDEFLPAWCKRARNPEGLGFYDELDEHAQATRADRRTILAQARLLYTFAHLALISDNPAYAAAARVARDALGVFRKSPGAYGRARTSRGGLTRDPDDQLAFSYDQCFVILALVTWGKLCPDDDVGTELEACWTVIETDLKDPVTGMLLEHDGLSDPAASGAPNRAQNPHMHLYEAALQAYDMTGDAIWLDRAGQMRAKGLEFFFDDQTGTIREFIAPDLTHLPGREGAYREVGHQCEWAWLLLREVDLGGDPSVGGIAERLLEFADLHGFQPRGKMQGAALDAVAADATWRDSSFLLWPQTEAIKVHALRSQNAVFGDRARALALLMFQRYFARRTAFANQLDADGQALWPDALSRLHYHVVLALTEGARAGLWTYPR